MNDVRSSVPRNTVVLAAGGTGGHLFPAQALAEELVRRGYLIHLMTDERVRDYGKSFPALEIHIVPAATLTPRRPWALPAQLLRLYRGYRKARAVLKGLKPAAVVGFGGYPSFPPIVAASRLKIPSLIHDQNAVMGRANRVLTRFVTAIAASFPKMANLPRGAARKMTFTGNPVRDLVLAEKAAPYPPLAADLPFNLVVFGGSQGAQFFSGFMPQVVKELPKAVTRNLRLEQQCRAGDIEVAGAAYEALELNYEVQPFFDDMPKRIAAAHLVICRSGASTIAELGVIGRPAIMVPLPHAIDNDQLRNAESFAAAGAGWIRPQAGLEPVEFAAFLTRLRYQEGELKQAAQAALSHGRPDAAQRLADLTERVAGKLTT
jgi:UDP-N-acetylglucosamine--N-acetylmuramyl-(pentapeptide) pyrophosphoryl-undecaprenol N-acetylglucosamine transferase